ncbi:hypothetical protein [Streptomyces hydrogenans]|uniref:hypothetical protein n=1 Tax=Streptomyces hydrogenans TaxID=1873719 RepID=UPI0036E3B3A7
MGVDAGALEFVLLVGEDLAADAPLDGDRVGVFFAVVAVVPVLGAGPARRAQAVLVVAVGEGLLAVAFRPAAGADAEELRVRDPPAGAQFEFGAQALIVDQPFPRSERWWLWMS